jgi:dihydroorotate dehydrogenase (fumarate)
MANLETNYLGLSLGNPIIISSSGLTNSIEKIIKLEQYGAGAVVLKSLFEEQIKIDAGLPIYSFQKTFQESLDYINNYFTNNSVQDYLSLIKKAKATVKIPIIASINCYSAENWIDFTKKIQAAGADALELNVFYIPTDKDFSSNDYEQIYLDLAVKVKTSIGIPFTIKLGNHFTNLPFLADQLFYRGASGLTLFNRGYEPDIDINYCKFKAAGVLSSPTDIRPTLHWIGIVSSQLENFDIAASTGVHSGEDVIKLLLAGAKAVQVCSAIYKNGPQYITTLVSDLATWMERNNYKTIDEFRGSINYKPSANRSMYERLLFMRYFTDIQ